ncbi:MAG TPA: hypothetical protein G4O02_06740 [Caldilineae bacterium]|jgi:hypothetical protein|nr:hypothetical protein [Caldilineae bacterium]
MTDDYDVLEEAARIVEQRWNWAEDALRLFNHFSETEQRIVIAYMEAVMRVQEGVATPLERRLAALGPSLFRPEE